MVYWVSSDPAGVSGQEQRYLRPCWKVIKSGTLNDLLLSIKKCDAEEAIKDIETREQRSAAQSTYCTVSRNSRGWCSSRVCLSARRTSREGTKMETYYTSTNWTLWLIAHDLWVMGDKTSWKFDLVCCWGKHTGPNFSSKRMHPISIAARIFSESVNQVC